VSGLQNGDLHYRTADSTANLAPSEVKCRISRASPLPTLIPQHITPSAHTNATAEIRPLAAKDQARLRR
jgi:hypothetical protein